MRLALKFAISFMVVTVVVWGVASYIRVQREITLFETDIRHDHESVGVDLADAVARMWHLAGDEAAHEFVGRVNESKGHVSITLIPLDSLTLSPAMRQMAARDSWLDALVAQPIGMVYEDSTGTEWVYTYVTIAADENPGFVLELRESLVEKDQYLRSTVRNAIIYTLTMGFLAGVTAMLLGFVFIAKPVRALMDKARRVAGGDLTSDVWLWQADELGELGIELNAMSSRLADARHQVAIESAARETASQQLRHADRLTTVGKLAASVAHELGTPLNIVKARARMIAEKEVEGEGAVTSSKNIIEQSERMSRTIQGLLNLSRRDTPEKAQVDLRLVVSHAVDLVEPMARKSNVRVTVKIRETPVLALVDADQIRQVLVNLMVNSVEAMPDGGELVVHIWSCQDEVSSGAGVNDVMHAVIRVSDTGCGISQDNLDRLFDPFFTTKDPEKGTGLGLSISADIVREHGGRIEVKSEPGKGSVFNVYLPSGSQSRRETT